MKKQSTPGQDAFEINQSAARLACGTSMPGIQQAAIPLNS